MFPQITQIHLKHFYFKNYFFLLYNKNIQFFFSIYTFQYVMFTDKIWWRKHFKHQICLCYIFLKHFYAINNINSEMNKACDDMHWQHIPVITWWNVQSKKFNHLDKIRPPPPQKKKEIYFRSSKTVEKICFNLKKCLASIFSQFIFFCKISNMKTQKACMDCTNGWNNSVQNNNFSNEWWKVPFFWQIKKSVQQYQGDDRVQGKTA